MDQQNYFQVYLNFFKYFNKIVLFVRKNLNVKSEEINYRLNKCANFAK